MQKKKTRSTFGSSLSGQATKQSETVVHWSSAKLMKVQTLNKNFKMKRVCSRRDWKARP